MRTERREEDAGMRGGMEERRQGKGEEEQKKEKDER